MGVYNLHTGEPKTLLCYGDSNTYGYDPATDGDRYPLETLWTTRVARGLGSGWRVISEGLNGRTTAYDRPGLPWKNGLTYLTPCLVSHKPLDAVTLMLGTNDCNVEMGLSVADIAAGMERLVLTVRGVCAEYQGYIPRIYVLAPAAISPDIAGTTFDGEIDETSVEKSRALPALYRAVAEKYGCGFVDCSDLPVSRTDCEHLTPEAHELLASRLLSALTEG